MTHKKKQVGIQGHVKSVEWGPTESGRSYTVTAYVEVKLAGVKDKNRLEPVMQEFQKKMLGKDVTIFVQ